MSCAEEGLRGSVYNVSMVLLRARRRADTVYSTASNVSLARHMRQETSY